MTVRGGGYVPGAGFAKPSPLLNVGKEHVLLPFAFETVMLNVPSAIEFAFLTGTIVCAVISTEPEGNAGAATTTVVPRFRLPDVGLFVVVHEILKPLASTVAVSVQVGALVCADARSGVASKNKAITTAEIDVLFIMAQELLIYVYCCTRHGPCPPLWTCDSPAAKGHGAV